MEGGMGTYLQSRVFTIRRVIMKIKLAYPKIPDTLDCPLKQCVAFEKYDGTNIYFLGTPYEGWTHFGTRRDCFILSQGGIKEFESIHPELTGVASLWDEQSKLFDYFHSNLSYDIDQPITVFNEYFGPNSFAGSHQPQDKKQLVIFDIRVGDKFLSPEVFINDFKDFNIARVIFQGKFTGQLFADVRKGKYDVKEGVVVKGMVGDQVYMAKIKTNEYLKKLKENLPDNWKNYWE